MAKAKSVFECQACGYTTAKWLGKCPECGAWDNFLELNATQQAHLKEQATQLSKPSNAIAITDVVEETISRFSSNDIELDLVLGGGIVPGSLILIGGSPGIGKSTLLLKIAANVAKQGLESLYVTGEESASQIKLRANRLDANEKSLYLLAEIELATVLSEARKRPYSVIVIDSIQTMFSQEIASAPGSVSQVREITFELMRFAKEHNISIFIIGHITKEGSIAGPRVLEHMVDVVLYFEGDASKEIRMLRGFKNRFGSTNEVGIFEMSERGLLSAKTLYGKFFSTLSAQPGSALTVIMEGSRPIIVEVQALVSQSMAHAPKRSTTGFDTNRLTMLLALLEKKLDIPLNQYDVFINITGGIRIMEPSADLAIIAAILSSFRNRILSKETIFLGEVSLTGDIREVLSTDVRLKEASLHHFTKAILPKKPLEKSPIKCFEVKEVIQIVDWM
ncbi:MAG: DNA repair protein RadA [Sulfuricurvum sp. PC08-66]|nr:MAG: DNA repair protein RadA [Sulfuricurvum sp. PC08-66]